MGVDIKEDGKVEIEVKIVKDDFDLKSIDPKDPTFYLKEKDYNEVLEISKKTGKTVEEVLTSMMEYLFVKSKEKNLKKA